MEIPATLPAIWLASLTRREARALLQLTPDEKGGPDGAWYADVVKHSRDMDADRWLLGPDAIGLLAHPGTLDGALLINGRDRLAGFLHSSRRKLEVAVFVQDATKVGLMDVLGVIDQQRGFQWWEYVRARGVPHAHQVASIVRTLHLVDLDGGGCLLPMRGGVSHSERWEFFEGLDHDWLDDCRDLAVKATLADVMIPMHQMAALVYLAGEQGHANAAVDFITQTTVAKHRDAPAMRIAVYCANLRRTSPQPWEALTWNPLVRAFHAYILGQPIRTTAELEWSSMDDRVELLPADVRAAVGATA